jgi:hypothetical protein
MLPNTGQWDDLEAIKLFRAALARDVDRIIVTPGVGDKPLWLSQEWGKTIGQFTSFFFSAQQRVLMSGLQRHDLAVLNGTVFSVALGIAIAAIKAKQNNRELSTDPEDLIVEGIDRSGITGWLFSANNIVEKLSRGTMGFSRLLGKEPMSRYASRGIAESLFGPSIGTINRIGKVTGAHSTGDWRRSDVRAFRRLIPFQNLFYLRGVFDAAEENIAGVLGAEGR